MPVSLRSTGLILLTLTLCALALYQGGHLLALLVTSKRGRKLTVTPLDASGKIPVSPEQYRREGEKTLGRAISPNAFALALMLASEGPDDKLIERRSRAWVAYNDLEILRKRFGWKDFTKLFSYSTLAAQNGFFGKQEKGRRYATYAPLYEGILYDAEQLLIEFITIPDPTGGAHKFVDLRALGVQPGTEGKTLASIEKDWGLKGRPVPGSKSQLHLFG